MPVTLAQLRTPITEDQALDHILETLKSVGFNTTSWHIGSLQRSFIRLFAIVYSDLTNSIAAIANFGFNALSSGDGLTEFSKSSYDNTRAPAVRTIGQLRLDNAGAVPHTVTASQLVIAYTKPDGTQLTYRNDIGFTVGSGGGFNVSQWTAETGGADWNIPNDSTLTLLTPLAGVTPSNPEYLLTGTWITTLGADEESDETLQQRNSSKWASLSVEAIKESLENVALSATPAVTRVAIDDQNPRGPGTVDIYVAGDTATAGSSDVAIVQAKAAARIFGSDAVRTYAAPPVLLNIAGTIYYDGAFDAVEVQLAVEEVLTAFLKTIPLGGFNFNPGPSSSVPKNNIEDVIKDTLINGQKVVKTVVLTTPVGDQTVLSFNKVIRGSWPNLASYSKVVG